VTDKEEKMDQFAPLQTAIEDRHQCRALHRESVHVRETQDGLTIWEGNVEVFALTGHPEAENCYAWYHHEEGRRGKVLNSENMRLITVLGKRPVDSPQMAVRTAIFYDVQPAPANEMFQDSRHPPENGSHFSSHN
jgi:hypothetical protein